MDDEHGEQRDEAREQREAEAARKEAEQLRRDREKAARAAEREAEHARKAAERAERGRDRARRHAEKEAARAQSERERELREAEREAARANREAEKAALDAELARQRAARHVEEARRRAAGAGLLDGAPEPAEAERTDGALPPTLAVLWRTSEPGRRGPRPTLTLDGIAEAAIAIADAEGLAAVSMARVAESLGVTTMALYRYVDGKDELLAVMTDRAVGPPPDPDDAATDWRTGLERWCRAQLERCVAHPWIAQTQSGSPVMGPHHVAWLESGLATLSGTPLDLGQRTEVIGIVSLHVLSEGSVIAALADQVRAAGGPSGGAAEPKHPVLVDYAGILRLVVDPDRHPTIAAALDAGAFDDDEAWDPMLGLRLVLDGVAALMESTRRVPVEE